MSPLSKAGVPGVILTLGRISAVVVFETVKSWAERSTIAKRDAIMGGTAECVVFEVVFLNYI
eukprot:scaffold12928_cov64-Cyclotella_meneghiniana.AAC.11